MRTTLTATYGWSSVARCVDKPTFLFSSIRSGSTLLRCILDSHTDICAPIEMHCRDLRVNYASTYAEQSLRALGLTTAEMQFMLWDAILARTLALSGESLIVDKTPGNVFCWREIHTYWPGSRNVLLLRHPDDVMRSAVARQRATSPWFPDDEAVAVAEKFLQAVVDVYRNGDCYVVRYEELIENPTKSVEALCNYLGVGFQPTMLDYGHYDHGPTAYGFGDNAGKIFTGRVQPQGDDPRDTPFANSLSLATDLGYSQLTEPENRS